MDIIQAIILGVIQGIAEFLPISSSGHLVVAQKLLGLGEVPLLFDVLLHIPTLLVVIILFRKRLAQIFGSLFRWIARKHTPADQGNLKLSLMVLIATVLTAGIGYAIKKVLEITAPNVTEDIFSAYPWSIGIFFLITAGILIASKFFKSGKGFEQFTIKDGVIIGIAQGIGVLPGISRSGITVSASLLTGLERAKAGEYAFLVSIPAVLGATLLELKDIGAMRIPLVSLGAGLVTSFVVGLFALLLLMKLIKNGQFYLFSFYLIPAGIFTVVWFLINR